MRKKSLAKKANIYELYDESVQDGESEVNFYKRMFKKYYSLEAKVLREDFCGSAKISQEWVKNNNRNLAYAVDLSSKVLKYAKKDSYKNLDKTQLRRLKFIKGNSAKYITPKADIVNASNFSYWIFKKRTDLIKYFKNCFKCLHKKGLLILDAFGGYEAYQELEDRTKHKNFTYVWEQHKFNPVTNEMTNYIHFEFPDNSKIKRAFKYEWRLWSLQEIKECLNEAGFKTVDFYMQGWDHKQNEESNRFYKTNRADADPSWIAYIVAKR